MTSGSWPPIAVWSARKASMLSTSTLSFSVAGAAGAVLDAVGEAELAPGTRLGAGAGADNAGALEDGPDEGAGPGSAPQPKVSRAKRLVNVALRLRSVLIARMLSPKVQHRRKNYATEGWVRLAGRNTLRRLATD